MAKEQSGNKEAEAAKAQGMDRWTWTPADVVMEAVEKDGTVTRITRAQAGHLQGRIIKQWLRMEANGGRLAMRILLPFKSRDGTLFGPAPAAQPAPAVAPANAADVRA